MQTGFKRAYEKTTWEGDRMNKMHLHEAFKRAGAADDEAEVIATTIVQEVEGGISSVVDERLITFASEVRKFVDKTLLIGIGLTFLICSMLFLVTQYFMVQYFFGQGQSPTL